MEFQHKGNKQTKKGKFSAKSCGFLGRNRFRKLKYLNATQKKTKKIGQICHCYDRNLPLKGHNSVKMLVECRFLVSAHCLIMVYIYTKFHENILNGNRVMERTRKVDGWTDGRTDERTDGVHDIM